MTTATNDGLTIKVVEVNPEMAQVILDAHKNYRSLSKRRVETYSRLMRNGKWGMSIIIFNKEGVLIDGQTRLNAVLDSQTTQRFAIIKGWNNEEVSNLDNGQVRSRTQALKNAKDIPSANIVASLAIAIEDGMINGAIYRSNSETIDLVTKHQDIIEIVQSTVGHSKHIKASIHKIPFARALQKYPEKREEIIIAMEHLRDFNFPDDRDCGLKMYAQHQLTSRLKGGADRKELYLKLSRALQAFLNDEKITALYAPKEDPFKIN